jgi:hypothetical protein
MMDMRQKLRLHTDQAPCHVVVQRQFVLCDAVNHLVHDSVACSYMRRTRDRSDNTDSPLYTGEILTIAPSFF